MALQKVDEVEASVLKEARRKLDEEGLARPESIESMSFVLGDDYKRLADETGEKGYFYYAAELNLAAAEAYQRSEPTFGVPTPRPELEKAELALIDGIGLALQVKGFNEFADYGVKATFDGLVSVSRRQLEKAIFNLYLELVKAQLKLYGKYVAEGTFEKGLDALPESEVDDQLNLKDYINAAQKLIKEAK